MVYPPLDNIDRLVWFSFQEDPVIRPKWYMPGLSDPCFLFPEDSPDGKWHLYCHSFYGIHSFKSNSGIEWSPDGLIQIRAHSPYIYEENEMYYLLYEKHTRPIPFLNSEWTKRKDVSRRGVSRIEMRFSTDLIKWSDPILLLDSSTIPFAHDYLERPRISRPELVKLDNGRYRLYFGASHLFLPDSGQKTTRYLAAAESDRIDGIYTPVNNGKPILEIMPNDPWRNLATGSVRIVRGENSFAAMQCGMSWDQTESRSKSAMVLLTSRDGLKWQLFPKDPILSSSDSGWLSGYVMSCDMRYKSNEHCWYCFFSANKHSFFGRQKESIGLLIGDNPESNSLDLNVQ